MSCPKHQTPLISIRTTDLYNSCTQENHLVNYPGSQLGMLVNIVDRSLLNKEVVGHWLEWWRVKSERPLPVNSENGAHWFFDQQNYFDTNPIWEQGWDEINFFDIFGYYRNTEDETETVMFEKFNNNIMRVHLPLPLLDVCGSNIYPEQFISSSLSVIAY